MAVLQAYKLLWGTSIFFVILPHLNVGLLSDYKICGDSGCESPMSRVQAIRDHHSKDCRFLSFRRGDTISVYHKLTGKRKDLWGGSIDKQFGYFPRDAVKEEHVHATTEKVVETQESDFFCMDESGYLIDSSHPDSDDDDDDDDDAGADDDNKKIQNKESETTQTTLYTDDTTAESLSKTKDVSIEPPVSAHEADGTSTEEDEHKNASDAAADEEAQEAPAAPNEQGGSASSPWLGSSVTGWLGLTTEEGAGNSAEEERTDKREETQAEASFMSSVTGWLRFRGEAKPDDAVKSGKEDNTKSADSFTSTMTGWLGFGVEKNTDHSTEKEQGEEGENEEVQEPAEKFRSRRMSLDLEGSQLQEEKKEEMGTLDWLGNGLSNTLGYGLTNQESEHERTTEGEAGETSQEQEEQPASSAWSDMGFGDILGFGKDKSEDDERTGSGVKDSEEDKTLEQPTGLENVDSSQSQPALTEEVKSDTSNESNMEESPKDQNVPSETETVSGATEPATADSNENDVGTRSSKDSVLPEDGAYEDDQRDISPHYKLEEKSQPVDGISSVPNSFFQKDRKEEEDNVLDDNKKETNVLDVERTAEMVNKDTQMPESIENVGENNNREPAAEVKTASDTDQELLTQSDSNLMPDFRSVDLNSNSTGRFDSEVKVDKTEIEVEERAEIPNQSENTEESTDSSVKNVVSGDGHEGEGNNAETDAPHTEISTTQTDDSAKQSQISADAEESSGDSQSLLSSDTAKTRHEPVSNEDDTLTTHSRETDVDPSDSLSMIGTNTEAETHQGELGQEGEGHPVEGSSLEFEISYNTEIVSENATEGDRGTFSTGESTTQMEDDPDQELMSVHMQNDGDAHILKETETDSEDNLQPVQTETTESEKYIFNESGLKSAIGSEHDTENMEESKEEKQEEIEMLKKEEKQVKEEGEKEEDNQWEEEVLKEVEEVKALEKQQGVEEEKQAEVEELKEEEKQEIKELKTEEQQEVEEETKEGENQKEEEELKEDEEVKALEKQQKMEEEKQEAAEETKEAENQGEKGDLKEEEEVKALEKQQEMEEEKQEEEEETTEKENQKEEDELKEDEEVKALEKQHKMEEEKQEAEEETKEEENQGEKGDIKEEEEVKALEEQQEMERQKQEEFKEFTEERKQEEIEEVKKEKKQEAVEETKEVEYQGEEEELKEEEKLEEVEGLKEEEDQRQTDELKKEKQKNLEELIKDERGEDLTGVEAVNVKEKKVGEGIKAQLSHFEVEMENTDRPESDSNEKETQGEISLESKLSETFTQTEKRETKNPQIEEEKREEETTKTEEVQEVEDELKEEVEDKQEVENVEGERRDQGEEGDQKCSNELCPQASEDGFVKDRDGNDSGNRLSSIDQRETETEKQNPMADNVQFLVDRTGVSQMVASEGNERNEDDKQEEKKGNDDAGADEGEKKNSESSLTGNEDIKNNYAKSTSDLNALGVNQIKKSDYTDSDLLYSGESGQNSLPNHIILGQTAENKEDDHLYSTEAKNTNLSDDNILLQGDKTKPEDTETTGRKTEQIHSNHETNTEEDTDREGRGISGKHEDVTVNEDADVQLKNKDGNTVGTEFRAEGGIEISVSSGDPVESQAVMSEQVAAYVAQHPTGSTPLSDGHSEGIAKTGSGGAFSLFKNAFSFFSQTSATEPTESSPSLDPDTGETSKAQTSLSPEQELDSATDSTHDLRTDSPITLSQQQLQPSPPPFIQTASMSQTQTTKTLFKHYKNFLAYMSVDETTILMELFGRHKLQFLDYILGSSESMTDDPDNDDSILLDIERLLHYHMETMVAPSGRLVDTPQDDKEKTRTLIALQKLKLLLARVRDALSTGKSDISNTIHQAKASKDRKFTTEEESSKLGDSSVGLDNNTPRGEWTGVDKKKDGQLSGGTGKAGVNQNEKRREKERSEEKRVSPESHPHIQQGPSQPPEGVMKQILDFVHQIAEDSTTHVHAAGERLTFLTEQVVSALPDDIRPGPDLYGVPWEPVIFSSVVGLMTVLLFTCRCYSSVKSRMYRSKERWMADQVAQLLDEKCKVLETLSNCQQEYDELESSLRDSGVLAQTQKTQHLEGKATQLEHAKRDLERDIEQLKEQLDQQREHRTEQERRIAMLEESMKTFEEETKDLQSQDEQAQTTLKVYSMNSDRLQRNLETAGEENTLLQESNAQLRQQVEGWAERVSELEAEMSRFEVAHRGMLQDVANKDERIMSLTDGLLRMKAWDSDLEEEGGEKETSNGTAGRGAENGKENRVDTQAHLQKVQKLIYAAKLNADLKSVDEDKDRAFAKLNDEVKAKEDLLVSIKELESEKLSLQSDTEHYSDQVQRMQQKLNIMTEMYQENELKLHRLLTVEEKERLQKEEKLNKADKNIALALEELNNYRQRAGEMEEELEKTKQSYQTQISAHEKKAHNNWLASRAAERELADVRRENALLRQKLTDTQFKLDALDKDPYVLDSLARPLPFRAERSPYGPSPLGRPASETRAFLSPPTLMDGPPARLSPRVPRGPSEPPGGQREMERSGGPHSDSGSISPTWERDRRGPPPGPPGPLGPPGYMFPEPVGPMYRRPPPPPGPLGLLPPPGSLPTGPLHTRGLPPGPLHPADMADGAYTESSLGPGEQEHRESGLGDRRTPPETDTRMGGAPPPGPPMGPMDGPFPRRALYGQPPPDFYPPRGPGGPPMMPMWAPPPPGMMFPPRFPPGGPPISHSHHAPPIRPPLPDGLLPPSMGALPPQQSLPSPPHSRSPEEQTPSPEDAI